MAFQWKERYSLDIPEIDAQHKRLFEIGSRAYDLATLYSGYDHFDEIMLIIDELLDYTEYHFKYEEEFMKENNYEGIVPHHREHIFYIDKIKEVSAKNIDDDQQKVVRDILDFLSQWISSHILISDRKYSYDFKQRELI